MEPYAIVNETNFPVIQIKFTGNKSTDENFQAYLEANKMSYRFNKKLGIIFDASHASIPSFKHQQMQAAWLKENKNLMLNYCVGTAYIIPNSAIRAVLKMIFSFQKQPVPYEIFAKEDEAQAWINNQLNTL